MFAGNYQNKDRASFEGSNSAPKYDKDSKPILFTFYPSYYEHQKVTYGILSN